MKVPWTEHKTNEEILKMVETERKPVDTVRSRQMRWLGLAVFADAWLLGWLAEISADLRENGSALEVVSRRCAIQIHDFTFTGLDGVNEDGNLPYGRALQREAYKVLYW